MGSITIPRRDRHFMCSGDLETLGCVATANEDAMQKPPCKYPSSRGLNKGGSLSRGKRFKSFSQTAPNCVAVVSIISALSCSPAASQSPQGLRVETTHANDLGPVKAQSPPRALSKFEARRIRHRCQDETNISGAQGANHTAALVHCFKMHVAAKRFWDECQRMLRRGSLDGRAKEDAIRACVTEYGGPGS